MEIPSSNSEKLITSKTPHTQKSLLRKLQLYGAQSTVRIESPGLSPSWEVLKMGPLGDKVDVTEPLHSFIKHLNHQHHLPSRDAVKNRIILKKRKRTGQGIVLLFTKYSSTLEDKNRVVLNIQQVFKG